MKSSDYKYFSRYSIRITRPYRHTRMKKHQTAISRKCNENSRSLSMGRRARLRDILAGSAGIRQPEHVPTVALLAVAKVRFDFALQASWAKIDMLNTFDAAFFAGMFIAAGNSAFILAFECKRFTWHSIFLIRA